jgi:hypothetical protein
MTSFDSAPPTVSESNRIHAYFSIWCANCDPAAVTARTTLQPTKTWRTGDVRYLATGRLHEDSGWRLDGTCPSTDAIEPHVVGLLDELERSAVGWDDVCAEGIRLISVVVYANEYIPALYLSAEVLKRIARLGASLDVDLYDLRE